MADVANFVHSSSIEELEESDDDMAIDPFD